MNLKNFKTLILIFSLSLTACQRNNDDNQSSQSPEITIKVGDNLSLLDNVSFDYDNAFFDDFSDGVNKENWYIGDQAWGGSNGGVIPENISYTDDGVLLLRGNGAYYQQGEIRGVGDVKDGRYTGAALISNFLVGPGRYEVKMKVLPRIGACTAFWTFAYEHNEKLNHEIDIELPGGNRTGNVTFENILNTNYINETGGSISQDTKTSSVFEDNAVYLNDGEWHTFGFDWYTNPEVIIYYLDGKVCAVSDLFVPSLLSRLWLGVWFPVSSSFVGRANFETDYMSVDYVKYIPFSKQPYLEYNPSPNAYANENEYPSNPVNNPTINKISNGTFEYLNQTNINQSGWLLSRYLYEEKPIEEVCYLNNEIGIENSNGLVIKDGGIVRQNIDAVYHNYEHEFSFSAKGKGYLTINYYSQDNTIPLTTNTININTSEYKEFTQELKAPKDSQSIELTFYTSNGNEISIDNVSLYQKKGGNK